MVVMYNTVNVISFMLIIAWGEEKKIYTYFHEERSAFHTLSITLTKKNQKKIKTYHVRAIKAPATVSYVRGVSPVVISAAARMDATCCEQVNECTQRSHERYCL